MSYPAPPPTAAKRAGVAVLVGVLLAGALFAAFSAFSFDLPDFLAGEEYSDVGPTVVESIQDLSELTTVEMVEYTTIERGEDFGWLNWARGDRLYLFAVARIGAGVDLADLTPESFVVDTENGTVVVKLPPAEVLYAYLDADATEVIDRDTGLLTKGDYTLETEARRQAEALLEQQAIDQGLLTKAQENAETTIAEFLHGLGYRHVIIERAAAP
jgi:hypothetical protein